jgi:hypothetical protein
MDELRALVAKWLKSAEGYDYIVDDVGDCAAASQRKVCADELGALLAAAQPVPAEGAQAAQFALEHDRTKVAECVTRLKHTLENYHWLIEGRGSYEWDDDRWHQEFKTACELLQKDLEPMVRIAADWSNCPKKWEDVQAARATPPATAAPAERPKFDFGGLNECTGDQNCQHQCPAPPSTPAKEPL